MYRNGLLAGVMVLSAILGGCATRMKMPFENDSDPWSEKSKPVFLMTFNIKNSYRTSFQPTLLVANIEKQGAKASEDRLNFTMDEKAREETDDATKGNSYLLRFELEPGSYEIRGFTSMARGFPVIGSFFTPLHAPLEAKAPGIYYLGQVNATVRERKDNEFKAGPSVPLIDKAVVGASGGTFDVEVVDAYTKDENRFRTKFPALKSVPITKAVLPAFDRAKAQAWWEAN